MNRKVILLIFVVVVLLILIAVGGYWYMSTQPFYKPGMVHRGKNLSAPLSPPEQSPGSQTWLVEPGIELAHFAEGSGRNVLVVNDADDLQGESASHLYADAFPDAEFVVIESDRHAPFEEQPETFAEIVREFLSDHVK